VVFAGGPRLLDPDRARSVLDAAGSAPRRVGVFGDAPPTKIAEIAREARLDVVQLHADPTPALVATVRDATGAAVWAVLRVEGGALPESAGVRACADALVLDAKAAGRMGGTGTRFDWGAVAAALDRRGVRLVLAGGLTPENVAEGIALLAPDVVDVSSGVERAPGVKDHARMRAFVDAVRGAAA
jgi:phosphoribosylanthranilate isomerase